ncbi:MAG: hypothetical protein ACI4EJ_07370 [Bacteroides sp.]
MEISMEITIGSMMFIGGVAGAAICLILFLMTAPVFRKQKKRLLEKLQEM